MMLIAPGVVAIVLVAAACGITAIAVIYRHRVRRAPRPAVIVASDTGAGPPAVMLRDPRLGLRGKPDYVLREVERGRPRLVALELKPMRRSGRVLESDAVQVAAYTLLLQATYGAAAASFGYLRLASGTVRIDLTPELRRRVEAIVGAIRRDRRAPVVNRSHSIAARCAACAVRAECDERLAKRGPDPQAKRA